jgi:H+-transporting ATPase
MTINENIPLTESTRGEKLNNNKEWKDEISPEMEMYLNTKPTYGLTYEQANERLAKFGKNELEEKKRNKLLHFLSFCKFMFTFLESKISLTYIL